MVPECGQFAQESRETALGVTAAGAAESWRAKRAAVLLVGFVVLIGYMRERRKRIEREPLSADEHAEAERLLGGKAEDERK